MKKIFILGTCLLALAACGKKGTTPEPTPEKEVKQLVRIAPVMTKVTESAFETGDPIGIFMYRGDENIYAENLKMVFDGSVFSGSLMWYAEGTDPASIIAYYPYNSNGPTNFAVQADQSAGTSASDFVAGAKTGVLPSAHAVTLPFKHKLTRIVLNVTNNAEGEPTSIALKGAKLGAKIAKDLTATVDESSAEGTIVAHKISATQYDLILPPQTVSLIATVTTAGGNELSQALKEAELKSGMQYSISMIVNPADLKVAFSGEISAWEDGGELGGDNTLIEHLSAGYITYHEDKYTVAKMKDGKWWMTQNMRYVPEGITVSDALTNVTAGVYYPVVVNAAQTAAEFSKDITVIEARGYLYQAEVALGLKIGDITTLAQAQALEGVQGICPKGWHVPTKADITALVGKGTNIDTNPDAPYYNGSNGSIVMLNEDGFNMEAFGAVTISDNTKTAGTFMGFMANYKDHISSGMMIGSTQSGNPTYNTSDNPESGLKNIQFSGFMPMTNKATEAEYTCNATNVSYRIAGALRCVRND